ncbi:MAG: beta-propeller fold lactonase family protein [Candidatus Latescibacteria bacterium]|jgi:6-phosphogluconolactonase|nr:beta-propeller fold lactonase family protein [Candidatus Latescibacterota bacterium]
MKYQLYVTVAGDEKILRYDMNPETGDLTLVEALQVGKGVSSLCTDPKQEYLYATLRVSRELASFHIDPESGALEHFATASLDGRPGYISTDRTGKYLFSAYFGDGAVAVNAIDGNGAVLSPHHKWIPLEEHAHCIYTDRSNQYLFVPHTMPANAIYQFTFDETTGELTSNDPVKIDPPDGEGPRHYEFHPTLGVVYFSNENGSCITVYDLDVENGTLDRRQNISTLPDGYTEKNSCAQIHIHPSGKFLYISNRGHNSIARFAVRDDGSLESLGQTPTEPIPRPFNLDPSGNFLFAAGLESGKMTSYRIDAKTGDLESLKVYDVGRQPMWILVLKLDG